MTLHVSIRRDTGKLWIMGTVRAAGSRLGVRVRKSANTSIREDALLEAAEIERKILDRGAVPTPSTIRGNRTELFRTTASVPKDHIGKEKKILFNKRRGYWSHGAASTAGTWITPPTVFLYIFRCAKFLKIGVTSNVSKRLAQISAACPLPVFLEMAEGVRADVADWAERLSHLSLLDCHSHSEWFFCHLSRAIPVVRCAVERANAVPIEWLAAGHMAESWPAHTRHKTIWLRHADEQLEAGRPPIDHAREDGMLL